jgi:ubiquinone/menaquinone biosynthesis C-methylase UbiE
MLARAIARQLANPHGLLGELVARLMNRSNGLMNRRAIELLDIAGRHRVLEVGFGGGVTLGALLKLAPDGAVYGLDPSPSMIARATSSYRSELAGGLLHLAEGSAEALPWPDESFDRVLSVNTLYFWRDRERVVSEIRRVLAPGGKLTLGYRPPEVLRKLSISRHGFQLVEEDELLRLLDQAGLEVVALEAGDDDGLGYACVVAVVPG